MKRTENIYIAKVTASNPIFDFYQNIHSTESFEEQLLIKDSLYPYLYVVAMQIGDLYKNKKFIYMMANHLQEALDQINELHTEFSSAGTYTCSIIQFARKPIKISPTPGKVLLEKDRHEILRNANLQFVDSFTKELNQLCEKGDHYRNSNALKNNYKRFICEKTQTKVQCYSIANNGCVIPNQLGEGTQIKVNVANKKISQLAVEFLKALVEYAEAITALVPKALKENITQWMATYPKNPIGNYSSMLLPAFVNLKSKEAKEICALINKTLETLKSKSNLFKPIVQIKCQLKDDTITLNFSIEIPALENVQQSDPLTQFFQAMVVFKTLGSVIGEKVLEEEKALEKNKVDREIQSFFANLNIVDEFETTLQPK